MCESNKNFYAVLNFFFFVTVFAGKLVRIIIDCFV